MSKKKLLAINLNEFNLTFLKYGSKKYDCKNIINFLNLKKIKTFSTDERQDKNLDPWVQSISINSGKSSKNHKIFNLGEKIPKNINQIWDILSKKKRSSAIWGTMNTNFKNNQYIKIFFPDPWNRQSYVKPNDLNNIYKLARFYAHNYTNKSKKINLSYFLKSFFYIIKNKIFLELLKKTNLFLSIFLRNGLKNYFLFFLFDIVSLLVFRNLTKSKNINFSLIFLNSLAHFQHNNWDNKKEERDYFLLTDYIFEIVFKLYNQYNALIVYNGFSQKKIKPEFMIRPNSPKEFFKSYDIKFSNFQSNMTNGAILTFKNQNYLRRELNKIKKINLQGLKIFEVKKINNNQLFCRIQIRSKKKINTTSSKIQIKKYFFCENKSKFTRSNIDNSIKNFLKSVSFIKTTSKHIPAGELFYENINIFGKNIENIKIYNLIKNYF